MAQRGKNNTLDEISTAIGEIRAYVHEGRHGINNLSMKLDASEVSSAKRHASLKLELTAQLDKGMEAVRGDLATIAKRVTDLERHRDRQDGAVSAWKWFADHWPFAALAAFLSALIAWANGKLG
jgi:hypothetical protein